MAKIYERSLSTIILQGRDRVIKLRERGIKACILKGDRVALDAEDADEEVVHVSLSTAEPLESLKDF